MAIRASAIKTLSEKLQLVEAKIDRLKNIERMEKTLAEYKLSLIRCRDMIDELCVGLGTTNWQLRHDGSKFLHALSLTIGDGATDPFKHVDEHNEEMRKNQEKVREAVRLQAREIVEKEMKR